MIGHNYLEMKMLQNRAIDLRVRNRRKLKVCLDALDSADPLYEKEKDEEQNVNYKV